jgi:uncharacterized protein (TIGR02284 family)
MNVTEHAVHVLNGLIETTLDSANGYREAAEHVNSPEFKRTFADRAESRLELTHRLKDEVRRLGGEPKEDQSLMGKVHNKFVGLKDAVTGDSDKGVIDEVERGEDVIKGKYEKAASEEDLPGDVRQIVQNAYTKVKADHDDISRLKHQMH